MLRVLYLGLLAIFLIGACSTTTPNQENTNGKVASAITIYKSPT